MVTSEAAPFVKTGGLADVLGSLPAALARAGEQVAVVLPKYRTAEIPSFERVWNRMPLYVGFRGFTVAIDQAIRDGVRYFFVDCPELYDRPGVYNERTGDYPDNHVRFALLNQAALSIARHIFRTDIFHGHDWPAGLLAPYLHFNHAGDPSFFGAKLILSIHNLGYQGNFPPYVLGELGLDRSLFRPGGLALHGQISFLKAGIVWSDLVTTVSPTYAREIQTPEYGFGMDDLLRARASSVAGILNGIDYAEWNPKTDPYLRAPYSPSDLSGKHYQKLALLEEMGLPFHRASDAEQPLIGIVSRFATQKGFELLGEIAAELAEAGVRVVALGSGEAEIEHMFRSMADSWPDRFAVRIGYDDALAHRIEAGADMFLMPSHYEPCGLGQIQSLRYGTVPIVRATGGLEDTVDDETGFKFTEYSSDALLEAIQSALAAWKDPRAWQMRMRRGMAKDFSWDAAAAGYQKLYRSMV